MMKGRVSDREKRYQWLAGLNHYNLLPEEMSSIYLRENTGVQASKQTIFEKSS